MASTNSGRAFLRAKGSEKSTTPQTLGIGAHTPPPPAARRGSTAAHLPPLRCAHGSETAPPCAENATYGHARRSGCVLLRGSGQPAPPTCCSRLRSAGCAVCPSRRSHTPATLSVPRGAAHTQPTLWAWPAGSLTCAGRVGSSRRRALRYGRWAAALSSSFAGGGGVWMPSQPSRRSSERDSVATSPSGLPHCRHALASGAPDPRGSRSPRQPRSRLRRHRGLPDPRRPRPPSPGSRNACAGSQPPPAPAPRLSPQGSGRSRSHARVRVRRSVSAHRLGRPFTAPVRPSSAPRGGARAPAPLPGLRRRASTRHRPRQIRQQPLCASRSPRPLRTTWRGTPSPA